MFPARPRVPTSALPGVAEGLLRRERRARYRELAESDPNLAREIGVGRPDRQRTFDDGGLVDLNSLSAAHLARFLEISPEQAQQIVDTRQRLSRLSSVEDLVVHARFSPELAERLREYALLAL